MGFQWDERKSAANEAKHGVSFLQAVDIFRTIRLEVIDDRRDFGEVRIAALGASAGVLLRVIYTYRDGDIRIVSAWRASKRDRKIWEAARKDRAS
jgi:hypothetical protein